MTSRVIKKYLEMFCLILDLQLGESRIVLFFQMLISKAPIQESHKYFSLFIIIITQLLVRRYVHLNHFAINHKKLWASVVCSNPHYNIINFYGYESSYFEKISSLIRYTPSNGTNKSLFQRSVKWWNEKSGY